MTRNIPGLDVALADWRALGSESRLSRRRDLMLEDIANEAHRWPDHGAPPGETWRITKAALALLRAAAEPEAKRDAGGELIPSSQQACRGCGERHGYEYNQGSRRYECRACLTAARS